MAAVQRSRPVMGLQHEMYRRSHRAPVSGDVHPEMLLDILAMECHRRKHREIEMSPEAETVESNLDSIVDEFKIDDSISACFASLDQEVTTPTKSKKSKSTKSNKDETPEEEITSDSLFEEPKDPTGASAVTPTNEPVSPERAPINEHRFRLPSVVKLKLRCGWKPKRFQNGNKKVHIDPGQTGQLPVNNSGDTEKLATISETLAGNTENSNVQECSPASRDISNSNVIVNAKNLNVPSPTTDETVECEEHVPDFDNSIHHHSSSGGESETLDPVAVFLRKLEENVFEEEVEVGGLLIEEISHWRDSDGNTVLHRCVLTNNSPIMMKVIQYLPQLTYASNQAGFLPIDLAVQTGHLHCLLTLMDHGKDGAGDHTISALSSDELERLITLAIVGDQCECLSVLVREFRQKYGRRSFQIDEEGNTPAHIAAQLGRLECLHVLHGHGFDLIGSNMADKHPARAAYEANQDLCLQYLIQVESDIKLVDQIVGRAFIIDRLEMTMSRCRHQIEQDVHLINEKLIQWELSVQGLQAEMMGRLKSINGDIDTVTSLKDKDLILHRLTKVEDLCKQLIPTTSTESLNSLRHVLRRILMTVTELDNPQNELQMLDGNDFDAEEKREILRSVQDSVATSVMDSGIAVPVLRNTPYRNTQSHTQPCEGRVALEKLEGNEKSTSHVHIDNQSNPRLNLPPNCSNGDTFISAIRSDVTDKRLPLDYCYQDEDSLETLDVSGAELLNDLSMGESEDESDWSSSEFSESDTSSQWEKHRRQHQPSKTVYAMLLPEFTNKPRSSSDSYFHYSHRHGHFGQSRRHDRRRSSLWDLRELRDRKRKYSRPNVPNEHLSDDMLREQRILQHIKTLEESSCPRTDLVETITTASGEVFSDDLNGTHDPCSDESHRYKKPEVKPYLPRPRERPTYLPNINETKSPTNQNQQNRSTPKAPSKTKSKVFGMITKLAKITKKPKTKSPKLNTNVDFRNEKTLRKYTPSEFLERYNRTRSNNTSGFKKQK